MVATSNLRETLHPLYVARKFVKARALTEKLIAPLQEEDCMLSSTEDTSPPKWHLAHTTWFFEHFVLREHEEEFAFFDAHYEYLFNSYYRSVGEFLPKSNRKLLSKPTLKEVLRYRHTIDQKILDLLEAPPSENYEKIAKLIELGINHEEQHQELLLMDIKRNFFEQPFREPYAQIEKKVYPLPIAEKQSTPNSFKRFSGGLVEIGCSGDSFHYDNEEGRHRVWIEPFGLSRQLVTNGEYLQFVAAGGYSNAALWLSDGWDVIQKEKWEMPLYWIKSDDTFQVMGLSGLLPMNLNEPVSHISYYEAQAFAKWKNARLPTETEWEHAASFAEVEGNFLESGILHPVPIHSMHGNVWEWTQSAYLPYPRYQELGGGLAEYNSKFMCNQFILRGGSAFTPKEHYRPTYRNFYYPHMRWQLSGFRIAQDKL